MTVPPAAATSPSSAGAKFTELDPISLKRRMAPCMRRGKLGGGPVPEGTPEPPRAAPTNPAVTPTLAVVPSGKRLHQQTRRIFGRWWSIRLGKRVESSHIVAELVMESHSLWM
ncbi:hypothetical protein CDAR_78071 [Caerostris darwini]|uniref:Uncharacterized protein n=1 Tax=Caerostris darwini TaxID=1538125 RepID=A0AAV4M7R5_9ARAC|nr:hypothetical protein CDAR_78071 [Caerostris darwini]